MSRLTRRFTKVFGLGCPGLKGKQQPRAVQEIRQLCHVSHRVTAARALFLLLQRGCCYSGAVMQLLQ